MLNYVFKAKNSEGILVSGEIHADRRETIVTILKKKGYYLLSIEAENRFSALIHSAGGLGNRVSVKEKAVFTHQLATLLKAGMQLTLALRTLSRQTQNKYLTSVITQIYNDIEQSGSLSEAMEKHPRVFSKVYTAIIEAAEQTGSLAETLLVLSRQLKSQASVNARIKGALVYPIFLLAVSALVVGVLTIFVIPKFIELFVNANQVLPLPTKILVGAMAFLREFWWVLIFVIIAVVCFGLTALKKERIRLMIDSALLRIPVIGTLNRKLQLAGFARTLGSLLNGGVRIVSAINTTKGTTTNTAFMKEIAKVEDGIIKGDTLAKVIGRQKYFGEIAANMIAVGEDTGMLPEMLLEVAEMEDQECESAISSMTNLLGPVMIVVLGLIIGFVVMAILMPIFETSAMVK
jgi:type IV pilus assembly protein PilC